MDYVKHPDDIYRKRTYSSAENMKLTTEISPDLHKQADSLQNLHTIFKKLKEYLSIMEKLASEKEKQLPMNNLNSAKGSMEVEEEHIFVVGAKSKVEWKRRGGKQLESWMVCGIREIF